MIILVFVWFLYLMAYRPSWVIQCQIIHNSKVIRTCLARGNIFENVGFPKKRDKTCRLLRNSQRQVSFHMYTDLLIMNAMCAFVYLFVVYFSFAPVISSSIHRYVNYFDIQVLTMVTETETLTSTFHHNIFTYLDYSFSATFVIFWPSTRPKNTIPR